MKLSIHDERVRIIGVYSYGISINYDFFVSVIGKISEKSAWVINVWRLAIINCEVFKIHISIKDYWDGADVYN